MFPKRAKQLYAQKSDFLLHVSMESQAFSKLWLFKDQTAPKHIIYPPKRHTTTTNTNTTNNNQQQPLDHIPQTAWKKMHNDLQELPRIKSSPICTPESFSPFRRHSKKLGIEIPAFHFFAFILKVAGFFGNKTSQVFFQHIFLF